MAMTRFANIAKARESLAVKDGVHSELSYPNCRIPMTLVQIDPRVASFAELHTFLCFDCGDVRAVERKTYAYKATAASPLNAA